MGDILTQLLLETASPDLSARYKAAGDQKTAGKWLGAMFRVKAKADQTWAAATIIAHPTECIELGPVIGQICWPGGGQFPNTGEGWSEAVRSWCHFEWLMGATVDGSEADRIGREENERIVAANMAAAKQERKAAAKVAATAAPVQETARERGSWQSGLF